MENNDFNNLEQEGKKERLSALLADIFDSI
jgi:hypothetical protein